MFSNCNAMTPADFAAISGNNDMFGNGSGAWIWIILILAIFGWGGNGWNGNGNSGAIDNYVLASDFATLQRQIDSATSDLKQATTSIGNGISSLGYDQLSQFNNVNTNVSNSAQNVLSAINSDVISNMQNTNAIGAQITALGNQVSSCCCDARALALQNASELNYRLAEQSCQTRQAVADAAAAITINQDANTRSILDALQAQAISAKDDKIAELTAQVNTMTLAASQQAQNNYIISQLKPSPVPAYPASQLYGYYNQCSCCS